ncbi:hypothetical protein MLD38_025181 [Melastoma candidum]|uniref:Uncharacterized protein n=1 Tax=Melastoma candidum TaxID=119954 RepID=A0ACB9NW99_9MYRT|nr:hypothetical protein MLD38_025181 [Melastoma candidum]
MGVLVHGSRRGGLPPPPPVRRLPFPLLLRRRLLLPLALSFFLLLLLLYKADRLAKQTTTVAGHNLGPTPWHLFPPRTFDDRTRLSLASHIIRCSYLTCPRSPPPPTLTRPSSPSYCPRFFSFILRDLHPWSASGISLPHLMEARKSAAFRVVIHRGRLFVDFYFACVQSRAMFTIWGLLQLLRRYPGSVPDVDLMFDCMDKPSVSMLTEHAAFPLPLFRYCTTPNHFDIPFPDWSFWGWPETNLQPWDVEFNSIKDGSRALSWRERFPWAYWKGNPNVGSPIRTKLMKCNNSSYWGAEVIQQNWEKEKTAGFEQSQLSKQCKHRYKIYAEGYAWSVSLKYILSCGSLSLIISPEYEDFFSRGLSPRENYWPISSVDLCRNIMRVVSWGNANPYEAEAIGQRGQEFMGNLSMDHVYDYMYNLLTEYSKLLRFSPVPPSSAVEICGESLLCFADSMQTPLLKRSAVQPSPSEPCTLMTADNELFAK